MSPLERHRIDVARLREEFAVWNRERVGASLPGNMTLSRKRHISNTMRDGSYKQRGPQLEIGHLNRVLHIDAEKKIALVEPCVTMEQLVDAALPFDLIPPVVTEFKTITVAGAINGAALESSSHIYSQFNDICLSYEILLGDGSVIKASAEENSDLYYGISGSYGTLGIILSVEIMLIPAPSRLVLEYKKFDSVSEAIEAMASLSRQNSTPEYLEGIVYDKDYVVVVAGRLFEGNHGNIPDLSLRRSSSPWFYDHVKKSLEKGTVSEAIPLRDYLFRHDRAAFWMGAYSQYPKLLFRYILEYIKFCPKWLDQQLMSHPGVDPMRLKSPSSAIRHLFGWLMNSGRLYRFMHNHTEEWFAENFAIQDYYLPQNSVDQFVLEVLEKHGMAPLWLCPIKGTTTPQFLSPHFEMVESPTLLFDVGVYAISQKCGTGRATVQELDKKCRELGGRKMLYAYSYQTPEQFWESYPKDHYDALRKKFFAAEVFPDITKKVLS